MLFPKDNNIKNCLCLSSRVLFICVIVRRFCLLTLLVLNGWWARRQDLLSDIYDTHEDPVEICGRFYLHQLSFCLHLAPVPPLHSKNGSVLLWRLIIVFALLFASGGHMVTWNLQSNTGNIDRWPAKVSANSGVDRWRWAGGRQRQTCLLAAAQESEFGFCSSRTKGTHGGSVSKHSTEIY